MQSLKEDISQLVMTSFRNRIKDRKLLVNMDETAVNINCHSTRTVQKKGDRTGSIRIGETQSMHFTLAVSFAMGET